MCAIMDELIEKATIEATVECIKKLMNSSKVTVEKAMMMLGIPEKDHSMYIELLKAQ